MKIENLVKIEFTFILIVIGGLLFIGGRAIVSRTGMAIYDNGESEEEVDINKMYDGIKVGMTFDEIREMYGEPDKVEKREEAMTLIEYWYYTKGGNTLEIEFKDGKVYSKVVI